MLFSTRCGFAHLFVLVCSSRLCLSSCVRSPASLLASASVSLRERRTHTTRAMRGLGFVKVLAVSTSCLIFHVQTHVLLSACSLTLCSSASTFACCAWFAGLTSTTLSLIPALCVEVRVSRAWLLRLVAILFGSALAEGLSVDAIVISVPLRPPECTPAEAQSLRLSAAVAAAIGCVPRGQWASLDADMLVMIDRSACLVELVLVVSRGRAGRSEHVHRRVRSLLSSVPIKRPCGRSCAPPSCSFPSCSCRFTSTAPATLSFGVFVSFSLTVLCTLSPCHLLVPRSCSFRASLPCNHVENGATDLQDAEL